MFEQCTFGMGLDKRSFISIFRTQDSDRLVSKVGFGRCHFVSVQ